MKQFDFKQVSPFNFTILDRYWSNSGIYMMIFPNGMRYLGQSKHINQRIRGHFRAFSYDNDWHAAARTTFTQLKLENKYEFQSIDKETEQIMRQYANKHYPSWKRLTLERKKQIWYEIKQKPTYYKMACDFFKEIQLWVWKVPEEKLDWAESLCLNQIASLNKKQNYYNTIYPKGGI